MLAPHCTVVDESYGELYLNKTRLFFKGKSQPLAESKCLKNASYKVSGELLSFWTSVPSMHPCHSPCSLLEVQDTTPCIPSCSPLAPCRLSALATLTLHNLKLSLMCGGFPDWTLQTCSFLDTPPSLTV